MTQSGNSSTTEGGSRRCRWCRRPIEDKPGPGRPRLYCRQSCRQRDFEARGQAARHGLDEGALIVARTKLDRLLDDVFVLRCSVDDARADLAQAVSASEIREIVEALIAAAAPVVVFDPSI